MCATSIRVGESFELRVRRADELRAPLWRLAAALLLESLEPILRVAGAQAKGGDANQREPLLRLECHEQPRARCITKHVEEKETSQDGDTDWLDSEPPVLTRLHSAQMLFPCASSWRAVPA